MKPLHAIALALASAVVSASHASITGVAGSTTWLASPPVSALPVDLTGVKAYAWNEKQGVTAG
ncbi:MAG: hypothetical protein AABZ53_07940, partial [Planctomycetota bacterium]